MQPLTKSNIQNVAKFHYMIVCTLDSAYSKKNVTLLYVEKFLCMLVQKCGLTICGEISLYVSLYNRMADHVKYYYFFFTTIHSVILTFMIKALLTFRI